jgi:hypothetical protein
MRSRIRFQLIGQTARRPSLKSGDAAATPGTMSRGTKFRAVSRQGAAQTPSFPKWTSII